MIEQKLNPSLEQKLKNLFLGATLFVMGFILYASLLPYNISLSTFFSFSDFLTVLNSSQENAAQGEWIGHVIFNTLLSFLACHYCSLSGKKWRWFQTIGFILLFGVLIEYLQMFVGARGTSISDIFANIAGMFFGGIAWIIFGRFSIKAISYYIENETLTVDHTKKIYLIFVVAVILFPFDFFINNLQLQIAFATKGYPLFENRTDQEISLIAIVAAFMLTFPLGAMYGMSASDKIIRKRILFKMIVLFTFLEVLQFFEVSGQSSISSLIAKITGYYVGFTIAKFIELKVLLDLCFSMRKILYLMLPVFIYLVLKVKGVDFSLTLSMQDIMNVFNETSLLPFFYYIDVSGGEALLSFLLNFVIFVPLGIVASIYYISGNKGYSISLLKMMITGMVGATVLELSCLIWGYERPDVTNIFVSAFAFPLGFYFFMMLKKGLDDKYNKRA